MKKHIIQFKNIIISDVLLCLIISFVLNFFYPKYLIPFIIGCIITILNFLINIVSIEFSFSYNMSNSKLISVLSLFFRILIVCFTAVVLVQKNKYNIIPYIIGYNCNILSIFIYGLKLKKIEGM